MSTRSTILNDLDKLLNTLDFVDTVKRGLVSIEEVDSAKMPMVVYNSASTSDNNEIGTYSRNYLQLVVDIVLYAKQTNMSKYYATIDDYVDKLSSLFYDNEQFSDNIISSSFIISEQINDDYIDGLIVISVTLTINYYKEQ